MRIPTTSYGSLSQIVNLPLAAAGSQPVDRAELQQAAQKLEDRGYRFQVLSHGFLGMGEARWKDADPDKGVSKLEKSEAIQAVRNDQPFKVASSEDLLELEALTGGKPDQLPSPLLAASLAVLAKHGQLRDGTREYTPYEAYNQLTRDPSHYDASSRLCFHHSDGRRKALDSAQAAQTVAFVVAGFGDVRGVEQRAQCLKQIQDAGYPVDLWRDYQAGDTQLCLRLEGKEVGRVLPNPAGALKAQELKRDYDKCQQVLGQRHKQHVDLLLAGSSFPLEQRAGALKQLLDASPRGPGEARQLYRTMMDSLHATDSLEEATRDALAVQAFSPEAYAAYRRAKSGLNGATFLELLQKANYAVVKPVTDTLKPEEAPLLLATVKQLEEAGAPPPAAVQLAGDLVQTGKLKEQKDVLLAVYDPKATPAQVRDAKTAVLQGDDPQQRLQALRAYRSVPASLEQATSLLKLSDSPQAVEAYKRLVVDLDPAKATTLLGEMLASRKDPEQLDELVDPARKLAGAAKDKNLSEAYQAMRQNPARQESFERLLGRLGQPKRAAEVLAQLPAQQETAFYATWDALDQAGHKKALPLTLEALKRDCLEQDRELLPKMTDPDVYAFMADNVPVGGEQAFLGLAQQLSRPDELKAAWKAVGQGTLQDFASRAQAWIGLRALSPDQATRLMASLPPEVPPAEQVETFKVLKQQSASTAVAEFEKIWKTRSGQLLSALIRGGATPASATEMARRVGRDDLPGSSLSQLERCQLVGKLAALHQGDLKAGFNDYLFLAVRVPDENLESATGAFCDMAAWGLSPEQARMACADLERRPEAAERWETVQAALKLAGGNLAAAKTVWNALMQVSPPEGQTRLGDIAGLKGSLNTLEPVLLSKLAAGHLTSPLTPQGLESLSYLLGDRAPTRWDAGPGWSIGPSGLRFAQSSQSDSPLTSDVLQLPPGAECQLAFEGKTSGQPAILEALPQDGSASVQLASFSGSSFSQQRANLGGLRGQAVRLRWRTQGASSVQVRNLKLVSLEIAAPRRLSLKGDFKQDGNRWVTSQPVRLSPQYSSELYIDRESGGKNGGIRLTVAPTSDGAEWKLLGRVSSESCSFDLSAYQGKSVNFQVEGAGLEEQPMQVRQSGGPTSEQSLHGRAPVTGPAADEILQMAFDPQRKPEDRAATLRSLAGLDLSLDLAWKAWPFLEPHLGKPDFDDCLQALRVLKDKPELLTKLAEHRQPGESLAALARLHQGRSLEEFLKMRDRVALESQGEAAQGYGLDFLGRVQAAGTPALADKVWARVAPPIQDEDLPARTQGFEALLSATGGKVDLALPLWEQLLTWVEPSEGLAKAADAAAQLTTLVKDPKKATTLLASLQASQLEGRLEGVQLRRMLQFLVQKTTLEGKTLEDALKLLPEELVGKTGVEEKEQHVVIGGIRVGKR